MESNLHRASTIGRKTGSCIGKPRLIVKSEDSIRGSRLKIAERFVQQSRSAARRSVVVFVAERPATHPNAKIVPIISEGLSPIHNKCEMVRFRLALLPVLKVMVGVLVALAAKVMLVLPPPGILALTEAMSIVLELENKGERAMCRLLGSVPA